MNTSNNIDIGPSALDFLNSKRETLVSAIDKLKVELANIDIAIKAVSGAPIVTENIPGQVKQEPINWKQIITELLSKEQRFLKTRDIATLLYPEKTDGDLKKIVIQIANALNYISNRPVPQIKRHIQQNPEVYFYGLPEWFDEDNSIKEEFVNKMTKAA
jgi:hypothetical protein